MYFPKLYKTHLLHKSNVKMLLYSTLSNNQVSRCNIIIHLNNKTFLKSRDNIERKSQVESALHPFRRTQVSMLAESGSRVSK